MLTVIVFLTGCTASTDTGYTRTRTPVGVTDSVGPGDPPQDTGSDTGES